MKRFYFFAAASLLAVSMALTGCDEPTAPKPVFASTTEGDIAVPAGGGIFPSPIA